MIGRSGKQFLLAVILSLHGIVTVSGPALHAIPGIGHQEAGLGQDRERGAPDQGHRNGTSGDDCPLCHLLASGQLVIDPATIPLAEWVRIRPIDEPPIVFASPVARPASPRAPPLA